MHRAVRSELGNDAHYLAFSTIMMDVVKLASMQTDNTTVAVICDDDQEKACEIYKMYRRAKQRSPESAKILTSISFADERSLCRLQAADLFSWVTRAEALYRYHGQHYSLRELYDEFSIRNESSQLMIESPHWDEKTA